MTESAQITIGAEVSCTDGVCGEVSRVVVDPVAKALTHLVVKPQYEQTISRLVPLEIVDTKAAGQIQLRCTWAEFDKLPAAEETQFMPGTAGYAGFVAAEVHFLPYYVRGGSPIGVGSGIDADMAENLSQPVSVDMVPLGEVSVRRGDHVHASDGDIGRVQGLVIDPGSHHVTHVLLQEGHVFGRKEVAIPIGAVTGVADGIQLTLSKREVEDLPAVDIDHPIG
jgi:sporulation protein YlmC with PRC-barrel domain